MRYVKGTERRTAWDTAGLRDLNVRGLPLVKPPYGRLSAIDLDRGAILWQTPHGATPGARGAYHPALRRTGDPAHRPAVHRTSIGPLVTRHAGGDGRVRLPPARRRPDAAPCCAPTTRRRADEVGAVFLPAPQSGSPMTYLAGGRQYIVLAVSGRTYSGEYLAFRLPG